MIVSSSYAKRLIREGKAEVVGTCTETDGRQYVVINRYDLQRTDHYEDWLSAPSAPLSPDGEMKPQPKYDNVHVLREAALEFKTFCAEQHLKIYAAAAKALRNYIRDYVEEK